MVKQKISPIKNKKYIKIFIALTLVIILTPIVIYLLTHAKPTKAWYSPSWAYRKTVTVANTSGSTLTNEDVLIEIDTATLITASKLQSDCDDLRFVDSDDTTLLNYWIEGGCNTSITQVWVRIPSLPNGGKTIYFYYGNPSATSAEASWSGSFVLLSTVSCPSGWTRNTNFDSKFPRGASTYNTQAGSSTHSHSISNSITHASDYIRFGTGGSAGYMSASLGHTHTFSLSTSSEASLPTYLTMIFCSAAELSYYQNSVIMSSSTYVPSNWTRYSSLDNAFPYGSATAGTSGGTSTHTHTTSTGTTGACSGTVGGNSDEEGVTVASTTHTHTYGSSTSSSGSTLPSYYSIVYFQSQINNNFLTSAVTMATAAPPYGWTYLSAMEDKFPMGLSTIGSTGGGAHSHTGTVTISNNIGSVKKYQDTVSPTGTKTHNHSGSFAYTSADETILPPYTTIPFYQRKISVSTTLNSEETYNITPDAPSSLLAEGATNPTKVTDTTPEFSAVFTDTDTSDTGDYYQIQVNTASDFTGTVMWDSTKTSITSITNGARSSDISYGVVGTPVTLTLNGTTYYWRIKFWDNLDAESDWSSTAQFTMNTAPDAPSSLLAEGATNPTKVTDVTPEFSAVFSDSDTSDTGDYYQIQVNTASDFTGTVMWDSTKTSITSITNGARSSDISYGVVGTPVTLTLNGTTYYWRVKFWDNVETESTWSSIANFTMDGAPTAPTDLLADGMTNPTVLNGTTPTFSAIYHDPNGDTSSAVEIEVNSAIDFTGTVMWDTGKISATVTNNTRSSDFTYSGTTLTGNSTTIYYWRIRFWDSDDQVGAWSTTAYFTDNSTHFYFDGLKLDGLQID